MRFFAAVLAGLALILPVPTVAEAKADPVYWLGKISSAGQRLNYTGTFIYQSGGNVETSRIVHRVDATGEHERLEVLDGSPREVIRSNREVKCVLPDQRTIIIDRSGSACLPGATPGIVCRYRGKLPDHAGRGESGRRDGCAVDHSRPA